MRDASATVLDVPLEQQFLTGGGGGRKELAGGSREDFYFEKFNTI